MRFFEVNVLSGVRLARLCLPAMKRADWGRIIFISSESALQIPVEMIHYGVTKTAQIALARGLAEAVACTGVTVNSVLPGPTKSRGVVDFVGASPREIVEGAQRGTGEIHRPDPWPRRSHRRPGSWCTATFAIESRSFTTTSDPLAIALG